MQFGVFLPCFVVVHIEIVVIEGDLDAVLSVDDLTPVLFQREEVQVQSASISAASISSSLPTRSRSEAARLQDERLADGDRMAGRDLLIAATARSSGDQLGIVDSGFQTAALESTLQVTNLRGE